jgi:hypothetical protein
MVDADIASCIWELRVASWGCLLYNIYIVLKIKIKDKEAEARRGRGRLQVETNQGQGTCDHPRDHPGNYFTTWGHFDCIFKATADCATLLWCALYVPTALPRPPARPRLRLPAQHG